MKLSLNWLKKYINHGLSAEELAQRLTMSGMEVEQVSSVGDDTVFEIEVTPNRPDCLSICGLAREVSAIVDKGMALPVINEYEDVGQLDIIIENAQDCARYIGTVIDNVSVKGLPGDEQALLKSVGANPICNIVDITNYVLFELGQPLHAFDLDKLEGGKIIVRRARKGEKIVTLDNVERVLDDSILVIADAVKPVAIAGIMGGRETGVTAQTRRVLLESASFDMGVVRRASRRLALTSDSCYRFERGVAWKTAEVAANRATQMILELAGGDVKARRDLVAAEPGRIRPEVTVAQKDIQKLLGSPLDLKRVGQILKRLGCIVVPGEDTLTVIPPHFRNDISIKEDVIEEAARVVGYDNLPMTLPQVPAVNIVVDQQKESFNRRLSEALVGLGYHEIITYALVGSAALEKVKHHGAVIRLQNPMSAEQELMRPTALPNMLTVAAANLNRGQKDLKLFEIGKRYLPEGERWTLSLLLQGKVSEDWHSAVKRQGDFFDLKGALEAAFASLRIEGLTFVAGDDVAFERGQSAEIWLKGSRGGRIGRVADEVSAGFDIKKSRIYFAEIDLELAADSVAVSGKFMDLNEFPAMTRDVSIAVRNVPFDAIKAECLQGGAGLLQKITFVELYAGDKMDSGFKGYVFSLVYQSRERTLTDDEVNRLHEGIIAKLIEKFEVKRR